MERTAEGLLSCWTKLICQRFPKEQSADCVYPKMPWQSEQTQQGVGHTGAKSVNRVETVSLLWCHW